MNYKDVNCAHPKIQIAKPCVTEIPSISFFNLSTLYNRKRNMPSRDKLSQRNIVKWSFKKRVKFETESGTSAPMLFPSNV